MCKIFWANLHRLGWMAYHQTAQAQHQTPMLACCPCSMNSEMALSGSTRQGHWFLRLVKLIFFFAGPLGGILWIFLWGSHLTEFFNFLGTDLTHRDLPKNKFFKILSVLFQAPTFLMTFFPKVQISKFRSYTAICSKCWWHLGPNSAWQLSDQSAPDMDGRFVRPGAGKV